MTCLKYLTNLESLFLSDTGSGDVIVQYLHGTRDVTTAILRIILGSTVPTNSVSLHEGGKLISYSGLVLGFGLFGDMMFDCEQFRWMGPTRYEGKYIHYI